MKKTFATICSGIGAPEVAAPPDWECVFSSDIEPFPNAVRAHHWPRVPSLGDMTQFKKWPDYAIRTLIGGTPCQSFSVAGLRKGLDDPRGNLMLTFGAIAAKYRPDWILWENVPGVLSSNGGRDFASFLGLLTGRSVQVPAAGWGNAGIVPGIKPAYGLAWRVLDAQYFGVAQRRRRVFVVGHIGGQWQRAAAVLFERESLRGDSAPRRETGKGFAAAVAPCLGASGRGFARTGETRRQDDVVATLTKNYATHHGRTAGNNGGIAENQILPVAFQERGRKDGRNLETQEDLAYSLNAPNGSRRQELNIVQPVGIDGGEVGFALRASASHSGDKGDGGVNTNMVVDSVKDARVRPCCQSSDLPDVVGNLCADTHPGSYSGQDAYSGRIFPAAKSSAMAVRRLTPRECERLQGFPDDFTNILWRGKPAADGPRYRALGNSMAVPNVRWILQRLDLVDEMAPFKK